MQHQKPIRYILILEGETMSQVTGTFTLTTTTAAAALAITPASGSEGPFPVGTAILALIIATVSGGVAPYQFAVDGLASGTGYELNEGPSADGVAGDVDITLSGTPTAADAAASPDTVTITVTDSAGTTASLKRKLN